MESDDSADGRGSSAFVFNPFAEGYIAYGKAFTPVKHQAMLAEDLANLPQFLCAPDDIVLLSKRPSAGFLNCLEQAGFATPKFVELKKGRIDPATLVNQKLVSLRPWAWGPDSVSLLEPLFSCVSSAVQSASSHFNDDIARLYSKARSAAFLRKVLAHCRRTAQASQPACPEHLARQSANVRLAESEVGDTSGAEACATSSRGSSNWLCSEHEVGVAVDSSEDALKAIEAIRSRGHHRVVAKEAYGLAGHNAIRLWEPEVLPAQRKWLAEVLQGGRQVVVEPWLERVLDLSAQLEMGPGGLKLCGYTGLLNDRKGQFLANWAEADYVCRLPSKVAALLGCRNETAEQLDHLYTEILAQLEPELRHAGFVGPVSIDAFVYRTPKGECRLKPVVEINPRYTMGRVTLELMKHVCPGSCGRFRLVTRAQAGAEGFADLSNYARSLRERVPLRLEGEPVVAPGEFARGDAGATCANRNRIKIRQGALCLNDPEEAQVCLATFEVGPTF